MNVVILSRLLTLMYSTKYRSVAKLFLTQIHLFYFKDDSEYALKTHKRVHVISHLFTLWLFGQTFAGVIFFNAIPIYNYFSSGYFREEGPRNLTFDTSVYVLYPFDTYSSMAGYICICVFNCVSSSLAAIWFCMFDLFLSLMVFHLWGHFNILLHKLNTFPRPTHKSLEENYCEKYTANELEIVSEMIKNCIDYHRIIIYFTKKMSNAFGTMLFVYYMFHQVCGCLLLLECSQMTAGALIRYLPMTLILYQQLIQLSVIFELIGSTSEKLKHAVYGLPWEFMDVKNRKMVTIFLMNVQEPIHIKVLGIADVGVTSMATILKTSLSYFTFLRSM
ncbi:odorant receptor 13a-like [Anticarsia gemmatalis]|uniref:odorant receptor 13a-like n=1 Tax=Anticarsia gemmatalis TaxID=129554 RepID=UPI003F777E12